MTLLIQDRLQTEYGVTTAKFWRQNSAAMIARLEGQFPLYRDIVQPLKRGILEVSLGLKKLIEAQNSSQGAMEAVVRLTQFPRFQGRVCSLPQPQTSGNHCHKT